MEDCEVREGVDEAVEAWGGELEAVEIYGGDGLGGGVVRRVVAVEAFVIADVITDPCGGDSERVGSDGGLKFLNDGVNDGEALLRDDDWRFFWWFYFW